MKMVMSILALAIAALINSIPAGAAPATTARLSAADDVDHVSLQRTRHRHGRIYRRSWVYEGPVACASVRFPRSPLCANTPVIFGPYGEFPWVWF